MDSTSEQSHSAIEMIVNGYAELYASVKLKLSEAIEMAMNGQDLSMLPTSPLHYAVELKADIATIKLLIQHGASRHHRIPAPYSFEDSADNYDIYPITRVFEKKLGIEYIKLLYCNIPPVYYLGILSLFKPNDEIVEFILSEMDGFMEFTDDRSYLTQWTKSKWNADMWSKGKLKADFLLFNFDSWNPSSMHQVAGRVVRSKSHAPSIEIVDTIDLAIENTEEFTLAIENAGDLPIENINNLLSELKMQLIEQLENTNDSTYKY